MAKYVCPICGKEGGFLEMSILKYKGAKICNSCLKILVDEKVPLNKLDIFTLVALRNITGVSKGDVCNINDNKVINDRNKDIEKNKISLNPVRKSKREFPERFSNYKLKYSYYDVHVSGVKYRDIDLSVLEEGKNVSFEFEEDNPYDSNAVKVLCNDLFIGYIPKNNIQSMVHDFAKDGNSHISGFVSEIDEEGVEVKLALGFYRGMRKEYLLSANIIKTNKKDEFGELRMDNLEILSEGDEVYLEYDYDKGGYIVSMYLGEIGELNSKKSEELFYLEDSGAILYAEVSSIGYRESGSITCSIDIFSLGSSIKEKSASPRNKDNEYVVNYINLLSVDGLDNSSSLTEYYEVSKWLAGKAREILDLAKHLNDKSDINKFIYIGGISLCDVVGRAKVKINIGSKYIPFTDIPVITNILTAEANKILSIIKTKYSLIEK